MCERGEAEHSLQSNAIVEEAEAQRRQEDDVDQEVQACNKEEKTWVCEEFEI